MIYLIIAFYAYILALRYHLTLKIRWKDTKRYWQKAVLLAICYRDFSPWSSWQTIQGAARAGFYSCAYDVLTDWRHFSESDFQILQKLLSKVDKDSREIILQLYFIEKNNEPLKDDGLERGVIALQFISKLMGVEGYIKSHTDFEKLGTMMQIVDDAEDIEHDRKYGDMNCFLSDRKDIYAKKLLNYDISKFKKIFPNSTILSREITKAQNKIRGLSNFMTNK